MTEEQKNPETETPEPEASVTPEAEAPKEEPPAEPALEAEAPAEQTPSDEAPAEDPDAKPEDLPEPDPTEVPKEPEALPDDEDLSKVEGEEIDKATLNRHVKPGMVVRVHETITDTTPSGEERKRIQIFEGTVLGLKGSGIGRTMTVRKVSKGFGVEKIYPLASPNVEKVEVLKQLRVRRAKLGFLRGVIKRNRVKKRFKRKLKEVQK